MPQVLTIRRAGADEADAVTQILAEAFAADPACQWVWDDPETRPAVSRAFFRLFAEFNLAAGSVFVGEGDQGVALWLPVDPAEEDADDGGLGEALLAASGPHAERAAILDGLMKAAHPVHAAHAYLPFIGVVPAAQGRGVGSALLRARTEELDRAGLPAYLEATTLESAALYARHGFRSHGPSIDLPGGPSMYPMWREPQG